MSVEEVAAQRGVVRIALQLPLRLAILCFYLALVNVIMSVHVSGAIGDTLSCKLGRIIQEIVVFRVWRNAEERGVSVKSETDA